VELPIVDVQDAFAAAIAKSAFPYRNGQKLDNLGVEDRSIKLSCAFLRGRYDEHKDFIRSLLSPAVESHILVHPVFGNLSGKIESVNSNYDERKRSVFISISFVVENDGDDYSPAPGVLSAVRSDCEGAFVDGQQELAVSFEDAMSQEVGAEADDLLHTDIDPSKTLLGQFLTASQTARDYMGEIDEAIAKCDDTLAAETLPASSLLNIVEYGSRMPGRFVLAVNEALDRICSANGDATLSPRHYLENLKSAYVSFASNFKNGAFNAADQVNNAIALRYSMDVGRVYAEDNAAYLDMVSAESEPVVMLVAGEIREIFTMADLDETLYAARELLQGAIDRDRDRAAVYKTQAKTLLDHVNIARLDRERIVIKQIATEMPLHLICLRFGLPVSAAQRVLAINPEIRNPTFVKGSVRMYAR
jgi:hypothetical protein